MKLVQKFIASSLSLTLLSSSVVGCSGAWWEQFKANPVQSTQSIVAQIENFLGTVGLLWATIAPLLTAEQQAVVKAKLDAAVLTARNALTALQDGLQAAADAQVASPDLSKLIADAVGAVEAIVAIVNQYKPASSAIAGAPNTAIFATIDRQAALVRRNAAKK